MNKTELIIIPVINGFIVFICLYFMNICTTSYENEDLRPNSQETE